MKNDWFSILKFNDELLLNENVAILLDTFFNDFKFKCYEDDNIIITNKFTNKDYKVLYDKNNFKYSFDFLNNRVKTIREIDFKRRRYVDDNTKSKSNNLLINCNSKIIDINNNKKMITTRNLKYYSYDDLFKTHTKNGNLVINGKVYDFGESCKAQSKIEVINANEQKKFLTPDVCCGTNTLRNKNGTFTNDYVIVQQFLYSNDTIRNDNTIPISLLTMNNLVDQESKQKINIKQKNKLPKIGF